MSDHATSKNPLLDPRPAPRFEEIEAAHVEPAVTSLLTDLSAALDALEKSAGRTPEPTWASLVEPIEQISDRLERCWGVVGHLMGVKNGPELRAAQEAVQPEVVKFGTRLGQSRPLYDAITRLRNGEAWKTLDPAQHRIVEQLLLDARLSGVGLDGAERDSFNAIQLDLAELSTRFSNNVLDATKAFTLDLTLEDEVNGLPPSARALAARAAREAGSPGATPENGPWRITLDAPALGPFLEHARRRDLREKLYRAYLTRASQGETDNTGRIERILALKQEQAALLGFASAAEASLATKMAPGVAAVDALLGELRTASYDAAV
ncbi:MAG: M3 family peptidase, partial [Myxococcales bacterium]